MIRRIPGTLASLPISRMLRLRACLEHFPKNDGVAMLGIARAEDER